MSTTAEPLQRGANVRAVGLVSGAHLYSHYYLLLLPPLFPLLKESYGVSYTELALAITVLNIVTALTQAPAGFLVDRVGARSLLVVALVVQSLAFCVVGLVPSYPVLIAMMVVAGLANAIYHPADYAILNASVDDRHVGRAFSVHTSAGFFGGFLAPATALPIAQYFGWQTAVVACSATGIIMAAILIAGSSSLSDTTSRDHRKPGAGGSSGLALLLSVPVVMGMMFYVGLSTFGHGLGNFSVSALSEMTAASLSTLGLVLSVYLFANPVGVLLGGWVADHIERHDLLAAGCFVGITAALVMVAALDLPIVAIGGLFLVAGLLNGVVAPSRDMIIRSMTPPGEVGKVFGFVSTGFNLGGIIAPPIFGFLLDSADPTGVFWVSAAVCVLTIPTVLFTGAQGRKARASLQS